MRAAAEARREDPDDREEQCFPPWTGCADSRADAKPFTAGGLRDQSRAVASAARIASR